jgi:glycosyltransferase involved in cell wall biosynthesis
MKLSIVHPVLNSHEVVRRQVLHYKRMDLPDDIEIIIVDDDSSPALKTIDMPAVSNIRIIETHDPRPWTWAIASNTGIRAARGEYILRADIDYIIPRAAIDDALNLKDDRMNFRREFGILDADGMFFNDFDTLRKYGLTEKRIRDRGRRVSAHTNDFVMRRSVFLDVLGGYREDLIGKPYPQGEDRCFQGVWERAQAAGKVTRTEYRPLVYMFPNGKFCGGVDYNPMNLFHDLSRKNI